MVGDVDGVGSIDLGVGVFLNLFNSSRCVVANRVMELDRRGSIVNN